MAISGINRGRRGQSFLGVWYQPANSDPCLQFCLVCSLALIGQSIFHNGVVQLIWCFVSCPLSLCCPGLFLAVKNSTKVLFLNRDGCTSLVGQITTLPSSHIASIPISKSYPSSLSRTTSVSTLAQSPPLLGSKQHMGHPINCLNCHISPIPGSTVANTDYWTRTSKIYESCTLHLHVHWAQVNPHLQIDRGQGWWQFPVPKPNFQTIPCLVAQTVTAVETGFASIIVPHITLTSAISGEVTGTTTLVTFGSS